MYLRLISILSIIKFILSSTKLRKRDKSPEVEETFIPRTARAEEIMERNSKSNRHSALKNISLRIIRKFDYKYFRTDIENATFFSTNIPGVGRTSILLFHQDESSDELRLAVERKAGYFIELRSSDLSAAGHVAVLDNQPPLPDTFEHSDFDMLSTLIPIGMDQRRMRLEALTNRGNKIRDQYGSAEIETLSKEYFCIMEFHIIQVALQIFNLEDEFMKISPPATLGDGTDEAQGEYSKSADIINFLKTRSFLPIDQIKGLTIWIDGILQAADVLLGDETLAVLASIPRNNFPKYALVGLGKFDLDEFKTTSEATLTNLFSLYGLGHKNGEYYIYIRKKPEMTKKQQAKWEIGQLLYEVWNQNIMLRCLYSRATLYLSNRLVGFGLKSLFLPDKIPLPSKLVGTIMKTMRKFSTLKGAAYAHNVFILERKIIIAAAYLADKSVFYRDRNKICFTYFKYHELIQRMEDELKDNCKQIPETKRNMLADADRFSRSVGSPTMAYDEGYLYWLDAVFTHYEDAYTAERQTETESKLIDKMKFSADILDIIYARFTTLHNMIALVEPRHCRGDEIDTIMQTFTEMLENMRDFVRFNTRTPDETKYSPMPDDYTQTYANFHDALIDCIRIAREKKKF